MEEINEFCQEITATLGLLEGQLEQVPICLQDFLADYADPVFAREVSSWLCHEVLGIRRGVLSGREIMGENLTGLIDRITSRLPVVVADLTNHHAEYHKTWEWACAMNGEPSGALRAFILNRPAFRPYENPYL